MQGMINVLYYLSRGPSRVFIATILMNLPYQIQSFDYFKSIYYVPIVCGAIAITYLAPMYAQGYGVINQTCVVCWIKEDINFISDKNFNFDDGNGIWSVRNIFLLFAS